MGNQNPVRIYILLLEEITLLCRQVSKREKLFCGKRNVPAFAISCYSMPALGNVENNFVKTFVYVQLSQKFFETIRKNKQFALTGKCFFESQQQFTVSKFCKKMFFFACINVKAMRLNKQCNFRPFIDGNSFVLTNRFSTSHI